MAFKVTLERLKESKYYTDFSKNYDTSDPVIDNLLVDYCSLCIFVDNDRRALSKEGTVIEDKVNPRLNSFAKLLTQKKAALSMLKLATSEAPQREDELDDFLNGSE